MPSFEFDNSLILLRTGGFTYLVLIFLVAAFSISSLVAVEYWQMILKREKEKELLFVGNQYRQAIRLYYENPPNLGIKAYPKKLSDLLIDPRSPETHRYLRRPINDPVSGKEWGLIRDETGGIKGVFSTSTEAPVKVDWFDKENNGFVNKRMYSEWKFEYEPASISGGKSKTVATSSSTLQQSAFLGAD